MLLLVLGDNFFVMFVGWEGVGLCSYLLIGFWYKNQFCCGCRQEGVHRQSHRRRGVHARRVAGLLAVRHDQFQGAERRHRADCRPNATFGVISAIALLLFVGATGKSAQIPLYVWLPDAMEGPTPVSALIHAATMVTAGVYLIGRNAVLFAHAPDVLMIVAVVGTATALWAGAIGMVQNDIKRVLAYSTVSQLGYMFMAMGVGAYAAGIFHLFTHAFFKALLFLGSGAVIHALAGEQDLRHMGGLKKALPVTYWTFFIGALAIAGVPVLAGFFSKDEILYRTFAGGHTVLWAVGALTSLMTAFYMFRLVFLAFHGDAAGGTAPSARPAATHGIADLHDAPPCDGDPAHRAGDRIRAGRLSGCAGSARRVERSGAFSRAKSARSGHGRRARCRGTRRSHASSSIADGRVVAHCAGGHRDRGVPVSEAARTFPTHSRRDFRRV